MLKNNRLRGNYLTMLASAIVCAVFVMLDPLPALAQDAATAAAPASGTEEVINNPYGLSALIANGNVVSYGTMAILLIMSIGTWFVMITKLIEQGRMMGEAKAAGHDFWNGPSLQHSLDSLKEGSAFRFIGESGVKAAVHYEGPVVERIDLNSWVLLSIHRAVETVAARLQIGLAFLGTVGSTAPFVGLFGTVWGIYNALIHIALAGQPSIDKVAGPVGEALLMTAFGLFVAVPAVLGYNWLVRRNKSVMEKARSFGADVHMALLGVKAMAQPAAAARSAKAA